MFSRQSKADKVKVEGENQENYEGFTVGLFLSVMSHSLYQIYEYVD
jgi:hypothetical protein